jgi:hypothetical protein
MTAPATVFFRQFADRTRQCVPWENQFAGTEPTACWLVGGGPSLSRMPIQEIVETPCPQMCTNLAGSGLLRPTFWTSYDPSVRFHRSIYLDPGVMKFVHPRRSMDLVPETTFKVCDCPNLYFFERDSQRGFSDFLSLAHRGIVDWNDTFVQAIDILFRLGFREILLAGCEMIVRPSDAWIEQATARQVRYQSGMLLQDFAKECETAGLTRDELESMGTAEQYHFDERKTLQAAINTDLHYFRIAQYLRLCRRSMSLEGLRLTSVTPDSRLNDYFPFETVESVCQRLRTSVGDPRSESTAGLYTELVDRTIPDLGPMRDYRPHHWKIDTPQQPARPHVQLPELIEEHAGWERQEALAQALEHPAEVELREEG